MALSIKQAPNKQIQIFLTAPPQRVQQFPVPLRWIFEAPNTSAQLFFEAFFCTQRIKQVVIGDQVLYQTRIMFSYEGPLERLERPATPKRWLII